MPTQFEEQIQLIMDQFNRREGKEPPDKTAGEPGRQVETGPTPGRGRPFDDVEFLHRRGYVLVRDEHMDRVIELIAPEGGYERPPEMRHIIPGLTLLEVPNRSTEEALVAIKTGRTREDGTRMGGLGPGVAAPDYLMSITGDPMHCPATEPDVVPAGSAPDPAQTLDRAGGEGVRVVVVDTGLDPTAADRIPWLRGVEGEGDPAIQAPDLGAYAGHGTFIAGLVRCMAPQAEVIVKRIFERAGATFETDLILALEEVLRTDHPDIISMSAGTRADDAIGPLGLRVFYETRLRHHKGVVLVAAAGNDGDRRPFWPAAAPWTVSVGALATKYQGRANFSNFGGWVDVYAPGQDLVNAFPEGTYGYNEPPRKGQKTDFYGMARWSGTSFATPIVAGLIAARMSHTGENGQEAAAALLKKAQSQAQPGVGAVLLPE